MYLKEIERQLKGRFPGEIVVVKERFHQFEPEYVEIRARVGENWMFCVAECPVIADEIAEIFIDKFTENGK